MGFWGCDPEGYEYDLFSEDEELDLAVEGLDRSENMFFEFDLDSPFGLEEDVIFMDRHMAERFHQVESGLSEIISRPPETSRSVDPSCGLELNSQGGVSIIISDPSKKGPEASSAGDSSLPDKQANSESFSSTKLTCQVQGCNADLTSFKDYYKRRRVCPVDTKKAKVTVSGTQKRFCQQCSRFHLLNEFDDDKRSCRRRLAGHNKRRKKPRLENPSHRPHKSKPNQYQGTHCASVYGPVATTNIPCSRYPYLGPEYCHPPERHSTVGNPRGVTDARRYAQPQASIPYFTATIPVIIQGHNIFHSPAANLSFPSPQKFYSSSMNLVQANPIDPRFLPGISNPVGFMVGGDQNAGSLCSNCSNCRRFPQQGSTVGLRQLSFNLSGVE